MFVAIQTLQLKKKDKHGAYREYEVTHTTMTSGGNSSTHYGYYPDYDKGRFDRPHMEAYKVSLHYSFREGGSIKKKQCVLGTISYYKLIEWGWYDYMEAGMEKAAALFEADIEDICNMVEEKLNPLRDQITKEFHKTEEYKETQKRDKILKKHQKAKEAFTKKYGVSDYRYECCYDVFGQVMDQKSLDEIIENYQASKRYQRSYSNSSYSNYSSGSNSSNSSSYFNFNTSNYTDEEKETLKKFYKVLSLKFHPDMNRDADTTKEMQLLNQLKGEWKI